MMATETDAGLEEFAQRWALGLEAPATRALDIMVDIDDVLIPTIDEIHRLAFEAGLHDGSVEPAWTGWQVYGCEEQAYWDIWTDFANQGGYVNTPPVPGAVEGLRRLLWAGHRIHLVTARGFMAHAEEIRAWTPQWVEEWAVPHHSLTFARDKVEAAHRLIAPACIAEECHDPGHHFDYAIDDSPKNIRALRDAGVEAYLLTHAHNRADDYEPRVETVAEFVDTILEAS